MPRAPNDKAVQAEKLFDSGMAMADIARRLEVSAATVRSWKSRYGWGDQQKRKRSAANKENAASQKRKRGGQPGNQNSKGVSKGKGNPHPNPPPDRTKHGAYKPVFLDALDDDEQNLLQSIPDDEEKLLMEQIQLFSIRERRILKAINKYRGMEGSVVVADVSRHDSKRTFRDSKEEEEYNARQRAKVDLGKILPGKPYEMSVHATNKDLVIARLEQELSTVQGKKTKAIEALSRFRAGVLTSKLAKELLDIKREAFEFQKEKAAGGFSEYEDMTDIEQDVYGEKT